MEEWLLSTINHCQSVRICVTYWGPFWFRGYSTQHERLIYEGHRGDSHNELKVTQAWIYFIGTTIPLAIIFQRDGVLGDLQWYKQSDWDKYWESYTSFTCVSEICISF